MNSPPKKRVLNLPKWGGGIPIPPTISTPVSNPSSLPTSSTSSTTSLTNDKVSSEIDDRFELIRVEINNQRLCNAVFDDRINFLEVTTQNIKSKVDKIIDHLEASLPTMHKLRKTLHVSLNEFQHHPGLNSSLNTDSGSMIE